MKRFLSVQLFMAMMFFVMSGCSIQSNVPATSKLSLQCHPKIPVAKSDVYKDKVVRMGVIESTQMLSSTTIFYTTDDGENYVYTKARWNESLKKKLGDLMMHTLTKSTLFEDVIPFRSLAKNDLIFEMNLYDVSQVIHTDGTSTMHFSAKLRVIEQYTRKIVTTKLFEYEIKSEEGNVKSALEAYNKMVSMFLVDTVAWLDK